MARSQGNITVTLSVLDRLIDLEPKTQIEAPLSRSQSVRLLKAAVHRDLEWLLNTRRIFLEPDESLKEVSRSLFVYGLADLSTYTMGSTADQAKLVRHLQSVVKLFEPRLANVRVTPLDSSGGTGLQELRLRIDGMLLMDPSPEPVSFDTLIELKSGVCRLAGGANER
jgi:type VI secretion system protein ImpF